MPRGGKREGAGRKPSGEARYLSISLTLDDHHLVLIESIGEKSLSAGLRKLLDEVVVLRMQVKSVPRATSQASSMPTTKKRVEIAAPRLQRDN